MYSQTIGTQTYTFSSLVDVLAQASPARSGDVLSGAAAPSAAARAAARWVLADIPVLDIIENPVLPYEVDNVTRLIMDDWDPQALGECASMTVGEFRAWLLETANLPNAGAIFAAHQRGFTPELIAAASKLMSNGELIAVSAAARVTTAFRSTIGLPGRLATRLQPNHPTDDPLGVTASIIDGLNQGAGDAVIGINPATDSPERVRSLLELIDTIRQQYEIPTQSCVLTHVTTTLDLIEEGAPVDLIFQSIAGTEGTNKSFGVELSMLDDALAAGRELGRGTVGNNCLYFETGQGSALSAGDYRTPSGQPIDQQTLEARAYGLARHYEPLLVNTVVGFIGPEYLYDGKQIIRAGLEDQFCGKLLGIQMGVDICYTNHAEADADDMETLLHMLINANTGFVITVPGSDDVMLGYQSLSYHDVELARSVTNRDYAPEFAEWRAKHEVHWEDIDSILPARKINIDKLNSLTPARINLGSDGVATPTKARAELSTAHALARDAVHNSLDLAVLQSKFHDMGEPTDLMVIHSQAQDRAQYLTRPDLGRLPRTIPADFHLTHKAQIGLVLIDGLSPAAVTDHAAATIHELTKLLPDYSFAPPVIVEQGRVALADHLAQVAGWDVTVVLIGERPGLSVPSSLGMYLTWKATPGTTDERRNCISNIHPPEGTGYREAAAIAAHLIHQFVEQEKSGYMIKAASSDAALAALES
ncbi:MAG: ethanolamine ammonia-lyase subunit EutC [Corynebacterium sp.]|nr:ethanolamine ammonia-lyase subunit EutC [Corynebacterium sp.]